MTARVLVVLLVNLEEIFDLGWQEYGSSEK